MSLFTARVEVDPKGYRWVQGDGTERPIRGISSRTFRYLEWASLDDFRSAYRGGDEAIGRSYDPFEEEPALFRIFARLEPTEEAILAFAGKYGDLCSATDAIFGHKSALRDWQSDIGTFCSLLKVADRFVAKRNRERVSKQANEEMIAVLALALKSVPIALSPTCVRESLGLQITTNGLLNVLHLQLAEAVIGHKRYRDCEFCKKPFEVSPQINRSDRLFCSDNCRVKAYQRRKKQVIALRLDGKSLREIAKVTETPFTSVKDWTKGIQKGVK